MSNLVGNAVTHGTVGTPVRAELVGGDDVVLTVHNASAPIPPETLATLFDPFTRAQKSKGVGLGLYIVQQIASSHRGTVRVESTEQAGTTFTVRLPLAS